MDQRRHIGGRRGRLGGQSGLTLIELLVVLSIIALATSVVVLNAPPSQSSARAAAGKFAAHLNAAYAEAVVAGAPYRLEFSGSEYAVSRFANGQWRRESRVVVGDDGDGLLFSVEIADASADNAMALGGDARPPRGRNAKTEILPIDPLTGGLPMTARFQRGGETWTVVVAADGSIAMERL